jgi:hypothetical protein
MRCLATNECFTSQRNADKPRIHAIPREGTKTVLEAIFRAFYDGPDPVLDCVATFSETTPSEASLLPEQLDDNERDLSSALEHVFKLRQNHEMDARLWAEG